MSHTALPVISKYSWAVLAWVTRFHNSNRKGTVPNALEVFLMGTMFVVAAWLLKSCNQFACMMQIKNTYRVGFSSELRFDPNSVLNKVPLVSAGPRLNPIRIVFAGVDLK